MERWLRKQRVLFVTLETRPGLLGSVGFFERHGYKRQGVLQQYYDGDDAVRMRKSLSRGY